VWEYGSSLDPEDDQSHGLQVTAPGDLVFATGKILL
jgi:hypothetical protein